MNLCENNIDFYCMKNNSEKVIHYKENTIEDFEGIINV